MIKQQEIAFLRRLQNKLKVSKIKIEIQIQ